MKCSIISNRGILIFLIIVVVSIFIPLEAQTVVTDESEISNYLPVPKYPALFKTIPIINDSSPRWVKMMYSEKPNFFAIETAYERYYQINGFEKNTHTQNYRYFSRLINENRYLLEDGTVYMPTAGQIRERELALEKKYDELNSNANKGIQSGNWTAIGPFETFEQDNGVTYKSSQVNVYAIAQSASNPNVMFAGAEGGGLFKTTDKALNWTSIADDVYTNGIGTIEVDPTNENVVFMAEGYKLYKTTDGGGTWSVIQDITGLYISDISINPSNPNIVLTAGSLGLQRSADGGATWTTVISDKCWDLELKTDNPNTVFVAKSNSAKKITEIWKSTDNGLTFSARITGWFSPLGGVAANDAGARIGVTNADPNRIYVILIGNEDDNYDGGVNDNNYIGIYRSDDAGETWYTPYDGNDDGAPDNEPGGPYSDDHWCFTSFSTDGGTYNQGFYDLAIDVSDTDADAFLVGSLNLFKSTDGGVTYVGWGGYECDGCGSGYRHPDIQEIEINGADVWVATDGGLDYYNGDLDYQRSRTKGINASDYWHLGQGWNQDVVTGGRYHNGNSAHYEGWGDGKFLSLGGGEAATGYVNQGKNLEVYHSDISGKLLPETLTGGTSNTGDYSMYPNESYYVTGKSEIVTDPRYWNTLYLGNDTKLWKSTDGGASFGVIGDFSGRVLGIEVCRNNPDVIYTVVRGGKVWKTVDAGGSWSELALPASTNNMYISVTADDENDLYLALDNGYSNSNKVFHSADGGNSWTNISDPIFNGEWPMGIQVQDGTDGGVYLITDRKIYYKNNTSGWMMFSDGLPAKIDNMGFLPFYRDGKVRFATSNRGIWESPFAEPSAPIAQPMVANKEVHCSTEAIQFEDFSILNHQGATWSWDFPGAASVSSISIRNPVVTYDTQGDYDVALRVSNANGNSAKTVTGMISVGENYCVPENEPKMALHCGSSGQYASNTTINYPDITNFSFTAWVKPNGIQADYSGIFSLSSGSGNEKNVLNFREGNNTIGIHWNGGEWGWDSDIIVAPDEWSFVAITVENNKVTVYVNEEKAIHTFTTSPFDLNRILIGTYYGWGSRNFVGEIEEATFWKRTLTEEEIRKGRHLIKMDLSDPDLIAYYQFNHLGSGVVYDKKNANDLNLKDGATLVVSNAPIGSGVSSLMNITDGGVKDFVGTDVTLEFPASGTYPDGDLVVSKINVAPDEYPGANPTPPNRYWVVNNYGANSNFSELIGIKFEGLSGIGDVPKLYELHKRYSNDFSDTWHNIDVADVSTANSLLFGSENGITSFSQFAINNSAALPVELFDFSVNKEIGNTVAITWKTASEMDSKYFEIQRSCDARSFTRIGRVEAVGNAVNVRNYVFVDKMPAKHVNYYRLKMISMDGSFDYSPIRSVVFDEYPDKIKVYPNPLTESRSLFVESSVKENLKIEFFNAKGKFIKSVIVANGNGKLDVSTFNAGVYFYRVTGETFMRNGRIVIGRK